MTASRIVSLAGFARAMPDVLTFATPVFGDDAGGYLAQQEKEGRVESFRRIYVGGEEFLECPLRLALGIGDPALLCVEVASDVFLVGDIAALSPVLCALADSPDCDIAEPTRAAFRRVVTEMPPVPMHTSVALVIQLTGVDAPKIATLPHTTLMPALLRELMIVSARNEGSRPGHVDDLPSKSIGIPRHDPSDDPFDRPRVLLVGSDEIDVRQTSVALQDQGFEIVEARSGNQAIRALGDWLPDIVVLDASMSTLDGFDTCREMRLLPGFGSLPVLMLTGLADDASVTRAYEAGATDFFVKSTEWRLLAGRLRYVLRASRTRVELERSKSRLARAQDLARMGSFDWRRGQGGPLLSTECLRVFGFGPNEHPAFRAMLRMVPGEERKAFLELTRSTMDRRTVLATDIHARLIDGRQRIVHIEAEPEFNEHGDLVGYTGIVQDVTDRRLAEDRIRHLANFDTLTGLPNRRQLIWRAERAIEHGRRLGHEVALLLIDLDRFKIVNDTIGHGAGDELLVEASRRLRSCIHHTDLVLESVNLRSHRNLEAVGRLDGDQFVALLPQVTDETEAVRTADRILDAMREPITIGLQECFVTASVGIAIFPRDGTTVTDLLRNSDVAMYSVKSTGRNSASLYRPNLAGNERQKVELESALHEAVERNELVLHYQPKIDLRGRRMVGVEALMRWRRHGVLLQPVDFIPLAEKTGLIVPLSEWAIREAARQARSWRDSFAFSGSIAINLPSRMFERPDLVEYIRNAVATYDVPPQMLSLEITETSLMKDLREVFPSLLQLNDAGVEISIDDFGTGYSSLAYLTTLPISELKIDRSFIRDLGVMPQNSAVVTSIVALARSLGLRVVAEGVENLRQMEVLHRLGCMIMQGSLFSKAQPAEDIEGWQRWLLQQPALEKAAPWSDHARLWVGGREASRDRPGAGDLEAQSSG